MGSHEEQVPVPEDAPRVAEIAALLGEIDALRTTLSTDLSLVAAALESGADALAAEVVSGDVDALRDFEQRALAHLQSLDKAPVTAAAHREGEPVVRRRPLTHRMLPAAPVLAAAAALVGILAAGLPTTPGRPAPSAPALSNAAATSVELHRLARSGAPSRELRQVAEELNDQLAVLVAAAGVGDPVAAQQARLLLDDTTRVLRGADNQSALAGVLAEARALAAKLAEVMPLTRTTSARPQRPVIVLPKLPLDPRPRRSPESSTRTSDGTRSSAPSAGPAKTAKPASAPTPTTPATPTAAPAPTATPQPSRNTVLPQQAKLPAIG